MFSLALTALAAACSGDGTPLTGTASTPAPQQTPSPRMLALSPTPTTGPDRASSDAPAPLPPAPTARPGRASRDAPASASPTSSGVPAAATLTRTPMDAPIPECSATAPLFEVSPLRLSDIRGLVPLGNLNPPGHTFPSAHLYFYIRTEDPTDPASSTAIVPVFAPAHMWITSVTITEYLSTDTPLTDYSFRFSPCAQVSAYFHHVRTLTRDLADRLGPFDPDTCVAESTTGGEPRRVCRKHMTIAVEVQEGELIGTAGDGGSLAMDFGIRDARVTPLAFANPSRLFSNPSGFDQFHLGVCDRLLPSRSPRRAAGPVGRLLRTDTEDDGSDLRGGRAG